MMMENWTVRRHPIVNWFMNLRRLGYDIIRLFNPLLCTMVAAGSITFIVISRKFRRLCLFLQIWITFALAMQLAFTAVVITYVSHVRGLLHPGIKRVLQLFMCGFLLWVFKIAFVDNDYCLAMGLGMLAIQAQYFVYIIGYNVNLGVLQVLVGFAGAVLIHVTEGVLTIVIVGFVAYILLHLTNPL